MPKTFMGFAFVLLMSGCGTMHNGPLQRIRVATEPPGAQVEAVGCGGSDNGRQKLSPATLWVSRRATNCMVTVSLDGYVLETVRLQRKESEASDGNFDAIGAICDAGNCRQPADTGRSLLAGAVIGLIGLGVDGLTGAIWQQVPSSISLKLCRLGGDDCAAGETAEDVAGVTEPQGAECELESGMATQP